MKTFADQLLERNKIREDLTLEFFKRWDALGTNKDDDFGEVEEIVEQLRELPNLDTPELVRRFKMAIDFMRYSVVEYVCGHCGEFVDKLEAPMEGEK